MDVGPSMCHQIYEDGAIYDLKLEGTKFSMSNRMGTMFTNLEVGQLGAVKYEFRSPTGANIRIAGNALTRDLTVQNVKSLCAARLVPQ